MPYGDMTALMYGLPGLMQSAGQGAQNVWGGVQQGARSAGNWAGNNPLDALSLGVGAAGTGMGIWDIVRANADAANRDFQIKHWLRQHPTGSYMPQLTDEVRAQMIRPTAANLGTAGIDPTGGAWRSAIADALTSQYSNLYNQGEQQRLQDFGAFYQGQGQPHQAQGSVAGLPQALQWMQLSQALRQPQGQSQTGAAYTGGLPGMQDTSVPDYQFGPTGGEFGEFGGGGRGFQYPPEYSLRG